MSTDSLLPLLTTDAFHGVVLALLLAAWYALLTIAVATIEFILWVI